MALGIHQSVNTCYGPGYIVLIRNDCYIVKLANWALAQGQSPTLYLQKSTVSPIPGAYPGTTVSTVYGPAQLKSIRADNTHIGKFVLRTNSSSFCENLIRFSNSIFI